MKSLSITETCSCGAEFDAVGSEADIRHHLIRFTDEHRVCREPVTEVVQAGDTFNISGGGVISGDGWGNGLGTPFGLQVKTAQDG